MLNQNILMFTFWCCAVNDILIEHQYNTTDLWTCQKYSPFVFFEPGECAPGPIEIRSLHEKLLGKNKPEALEIVYVLHSKVTWYPNLEPYSYC